MAGQAMVTIGASQWAVSVAVSAAELASGLSGIPSIPASTGILFDLGSDRGSIDINMSLMLFSLDIAFVHSLGAVVGVLHGVAPGEAAAFDAGNGLSARYFLEVNAGEMSSVEVGESVDISGYTPSTGVDLGQIMQAVVMMGMVGIMAKTIISK